MRTYFLILVSLLLIAAPYVASADLLFSFDEPIADLAPGGSVGYMTTLSNSGSADLYLNGLSFTWATGGTGVSVDDGPFFTSLPWPLAAGDTWHDVLFTVNTDPACDLGIHSAFVDIYGGADGSSSEALGYALFSINVQPVPEPSSLLAVASGLGGLVAILRRRCL